MSTIQYNYAANVAANALTKNEKLMDGSTIFWHPGWDRG